ncbi:carboxymuconolactone decarboxylase family protein [Corynebacterium phoceense]|uniref:carboxymuconolactone decarboxylase family protein n=1 Tax=Corynebacterium phoceense TaxID=1686286 RepID=UPI00211C3857|nr:carboxymuconolactone decarboxylase family protein [Corynebacterium phoceense]MCQ9330429.1 carboxymuconolactone decarboxylase family protein [Corynebacterium phoceense]
MSEHTNTPRKLPYIDKAHPALFKAYANVSTQVHKAFDKAGIGRELVELVNVRVSQINGCPTCLSIHMPAARKAGVTDLELDNVAAWPTSDIFSDAQRAALHLAEVLTRSSTAAPLANDELHEAVGAALEVFTEEQVSALEWGIITINSFNRISIASGHPVMRAGYR